MERREMTEDKVREETWSLQFGARPSADGSTVFRVWAPLAETLAVKIVGDDAQTVSMERRADDVFEAVVPGVGAGADYFYLLDGERERPDPVSRWQPQGVHAASRVYDPEAFAWTDGDWRGLPLTEFVIYELHTGTFTPAGTFDAIIPQLSHLKELGVTAVELMPVAEFPGGRNWGYDGTYPYAAQSTYGGPEALKRLIDACHGAGLAVVLDVVYNHLGPEGNYLGEYAPIFNRNYRSPWGDALNFDGADSDGVRRFFIDNALYWLTEFHIDALRLDAVHAIIDTGARHLLEELTDAFHRQAAALGRRAWTIAESDLNDVRLLKPASVGGYDLDSQWSDDFHHSLHALLTRTERGYFMDFGRVADLAKAIQEGFVYDGRRSSYRRRRHGNSSAARPGQQFVVCIQNHDQIANGYWGDRLSMLVSLEAEKAAAALLMTTPNVPMLFMGQEWGERAPFLYFTSHTDAALAESVRQGRREEYASFVKDEGETQSALGGFADPQAEATFEQSKLVWSRLSESPHREMHAFYRDLLALRHRSTALANCDKERTRVEFDEGQQWITVERGDADGSRALLVCNLSETAQEIPVRAGGAWRLALWSGDARYGGGAELVAPASAVEGDAQASVRLSGWNAALYIGG
ncbi:MAG TPA: malto-oligosyltrehalose trehalohydrolase [Pyrinomonadaceae bacterium]|nr:malto-oligosyltrehalose trehalohydrolase [Pyrinomonadaceae bacterium]